MQNITFNLMGIDFDWLLLMMITDILVLVQ